MIEELLKHRGTLSSRLIAEKYGMSVSQVRYQFKKLKCERLQAGRPKLKFEDEKVPVGGYVKRKHFKLVQDKINELVKDYR